MTDLLEKGVFQFGVPIEKSYTDENGDVIVEGIASAPQQDHQGEHLDPKGFVLDYFEKSGWIKWEHKGAHGPAGPSQFIGEPLEAKITPEGQFYLKARLYPHMPLTQEVVTALDGLEKSHSSRQMGFSIEGQALQRDPKNPTKVLKAVIRNVVLTMNPVNGGTWARLAKSLTDGDALTMDLDDTFSVEKALDVAAAAPIIPQSLEGVKKPKKDEDETTKTLKAFRSYVKRALNRNVQKSLLDTSRQNVIMGAYDHAVDAGLDEKQAGEFAVYIDENSSLLKSILSQTGQGGANLMKLSDILGETMDELEKSLVPEVTEEDELDALIKSLSDEDEDHEEDHEDDEEEEEEEGGKEDETHKSLMDDELDLVKSLSEESIQALDVSDFLDDLVKSINTTIGGFSEGQGELAKSLGVMGRALKTSLDSQKELTELVKGLQDQVQELGAKPVGRRSAITPAEVATVQRTQPLEPSNELSKSQTLDLLVKSFEEGKIPMTAITAYEQGYPLHEAHKKAIGLI